MKHQILRAVARAAAHSSAGALTLAGLPLWLSLICWLVNGLGLELALVLEPRKKSPGKLELPR